MLARVLALGLVTSGITACAPHPATPSSLSPPSVTATASTEPLPEAPPLEVVLAGPTFTPFTEPPTLLNRDEVHRAQEREHDALEGNSGTARIYFLIAPDGEVLDRVLHETSGNAAVDAAALRVSAVHEFSPAKNRREPVHVWILLPIAVAGRLDESGTPGPAF